MEQNMKIGSMKADYRDEILYQLLIRRRESRCDVRSPGLQYMVWVISSGAPRDQKKWKTRATTPASYVYRSFFFVPWRLYPCGSHTPTGLLNAVVHVSITINILGIQFPVCRHRSQHNSPSDWSRILAEKQWLEPFFQTILDGFSHKKAPHLFPSSLIHIFLGFSGKFRATPGAINRSRARNDRAYQGSATTQISCVLAPPASAA